MANAVLGSPPARAGSRPARVRVQPTRGMGDVSPFFARLVRGSDARVFRAGRKRGLISLGTSRQHLQEDDNWSDPLQDAGLSEDGQGRRGRRSIVADSDDEEEPHDSADLRPGQVVSGNKRSRTEAPAAVRARKSPRLANDPGGVGCGKRRAEAEKGRKVKQRTALGGVRSPPRFL